MPRDALVFDIETIPDLTSENRDAVTALAAGKQMAPEQYAALCPPLARVVCIAWLDVATDTLGACFDAALGAGDHPHSVAVADAAGAPGGRVCSLQGCAGEADVLQQFGGLVEQRCRQADARLVTFNGRGFDLPVLVHRAVKHGVRAGRALLAKAAGENRYKPLLHLDLMDVVTFAGAAPRWPLAAYAIGYGCRSPKADMSGAQVWPAVQAGRLLDVVRYCAGDVLATAHVYRCLVEHGIEGGAD